MQVMEKTCGVPKVLLLMGSFYVPTWLICIEDTTWFKRFANSSRTVIFQNFLVSNALSGTILDLSTGSSELLESNRK